MTTSKDNPYKPGTNEWKSFEKINVIGENQYKGSVAYNEAKTVADKRLKTATEQIRLQEEKGVWVDEILEFLDGDEPEYDEKLDGPKAVDTYWKSAGTIDDPLNWRHLVDQYFKKPIFKGNHVLPKSLPSNISDEQLYSTIIDVSMYEYPEEIYRRGWIAVPIKKPISWYTQSILDPTDLNYSVAEFYIRRKK